MPRFSIVIPTRNRPELLRYALASALGQRHEDFEVVVSDNDPAESAKPVVDRAQDPRVRYVRTGHDFSMPESWEFALGHAEGELITYLCDDDALAPGLLGHCDRVLSSSGGLVVAWLGGSYADSTWFDPRERNKLNLPTFTGEVFRYASRPRLADLFRLEGYGLPMFVNSFLHRSLIESVRRRGGRFFIGAAPDYSTAVAVLSSVKEYFYIDQVLSVGGATAKSTGMAARHNRGEAFSRYLKEFDSAKLFRHVPLRLQTANNIVADTILEVRAALRGELLAYDLDLVRYFLACAGELSTYERAGAEMSDEWQHFHSVLDQQPAEVVRDVRAGLARKVGAPKRPPVVVDCEVAGLTNIVDCARFAENAPITSKGRVKRTIVRLCGPAIGLWVVRVLRAVKRRAGGR